MRRSERLSKKPKVCYNEASLAKQRVRDNDQGRLPTTPGKKTGSTNSKKSRATALDLDSMEALPDDVLVRIGMAVGELCGLQDYVFFSMASKRHKKLLMDSEAIVTQVIDTRMDNLMRDEPCWYEDNLEYPVVSWNRIDTTGDDVDTTGDDADRSTESVFHDEVTNESFERRMSWVPSDPCTLEQLAFFETIRTLEFFDDNNILAGVTDGEFIVASFEQLNAIRKVLQKFPSIMVLLEVHGSYHIFHLLFHEVVEGIVERIVDESANPELGTRISVRNWGITVQRVAQRFPEFDALVEMYLCLPGPGNRHTRYPRRPWYYYERPLEEPLARSRALDGRWHPSTVGALGL